MAQESWQRKASATETVMQQTCSNGMLLVCYRMSVCARQPLQRDLVQRALSCLYRKSLNLRICFAWKEDGLWFKEMEEEKIDFEVTSAHVDEVTDYMHNQIYSTDGPLWRARLLPVPSPQYQPSNLASFHEDLATTFPHCYHIVFGFNHAIGDGHSFIRICAAFATILNSLLAGKEVDNEQICEFELNEAYLREENECVERISNDESLRDEHIRMIYEGKCGPSLLHHIFTAADGPRTTKIYSQILDQPTTSRLLEKCRARKVTVSSLMAAIGNMALVDLLVEKGVTRDSYCISNRHLVNMRRFWPKEMREKAFGAYITTSPPQFFNTPRTVDEENFWEYVEDVQKRFYNLLNDEYLQKSSFVLWCYGYGHMDYIRSDLTFNTRGDITRMFEGSKEITVTNLINTTSIHKVDIPWDDIFGTLRGRLTHTIKYNTGLISDATALKYSGFVYAWMLRAAGPWNEPRSMTESCVLEGVAQHVED